MRLLRGSISLAVFMVVFFVPCAFAHPMVWDPAFDRGVQLYYRGDLKNSLPIFKKSSEMNPQDSTSAYLYAVTLQRLGYRDKATVKYEEILERFPKSDASMLAQTALRFLAPGYLQRWRAAHAGEYSAIAPTGAGVAPDLWPAWRTLTSEDTWIFQLNGTRMVVDARIQGCQQKVILNPTEEKSIMGRNNMRAAGMADANTYGIEQEDPIIRCSVSVGRLHRQEFPIHIVEQATLPILGQDFFRNYSYTINKVGNTIHILKRADTDVEKQTTFARDYFDIPITKVGNAILANVSIDGTVIQMDLNHGDANSIFSTAQINAIDPGYLMQGGSDDPDVQLNNNVLSTNASFKLKRVQLGKIQRTNCQANCIDYTNPRYTGYHWGASDYPCLGRTFWEGWEINLDEKRMLATFKRIVDPYQHRLKSNFR